MGAEMFGKSANHAFLDCSIFTGKGFREGNIIVRDGYIESVHFGSDQRPRSIGDSDVHECKGCKVLPALYDAHMHLFEWGINRLAIDLTAARSAEEILGSLDRVYSGETENWMFSSTGLLWAVDYDDSDYRSPFRTSASDLDRRYGGHPVLIKRVDGHLAFASTSFLEGHDGLMDKAPDGMLDDRTGLEAVHGVPIDPKASIDAFLKAREMLWSLGVAGGVEITSLERYPLFNDSFFACGGGLKLSISLVTDLKGERREKNLHSMQDITHSSWEMRSSMCLPVFFLKAFADGSIGARTASFSVPYRDGGPCDPSMSAKDVLDFASDCEDLGLVPMIHAIGDRALDSVISGMRSQGGIARVEHLEYVRPDQIGSLNGSRIIGCMQPNFQSRWGGPGALYDSRLGPLYRELNHFVRIRSSGIPLCFGTDLMPPGPLASFGGSTDHPNPKARLDLPEVIKNFTSRSVQYSFIPRATGKLDPGSPGDILVLDKGGLPYIVSIDGRVVLDRSKDRKNGERKIMANTKKFL